MQCIRDAALRYCRGLDRLDVELMKSAYWEGATDDHGVRADEICAQISESTGLPCFDPLKESSDAIVLDLMS